MNYRVTYDSKMTQQKHNEDLHNEFYQNKISIVTASMVFTGSQSLIYYCSQCYQQNH